MRRRPSASRVGSSDLHDDERPPVVCDDVEERARDAFVGRVVDRRLDRVEAGQVGDDRVRARRQRHVAFEDVDGDAGIVADVGVAAGERVVERRLAGVRACPRARW